jgi:hypothetical protein
MAGLDVRLHADYSHDENYQRSAGDGKVVMVAHRPDRADTRHASALSGDAAATG